MTDKNEGVRDDRAKPALPDEKTLEADKKRVREIQDQGGPFQEKSHKQNNK